MPQTNTWPGGCKYLFFYLKYKARHISATSTLPGGQRYLFFYPKYKACQVPETLLVAGTCFSTQNMKPSIYLRPGQSQVPIFRPKIWSPSSIWDLTGCRYLFFYLKYEARHVFEIWPPYYPPKTWGATCTCHQYLLCNLKYQAHHVSAVWPVASTCFFIQNMKLRIWTWNLAALLPNQNIKHDVYLLWIFALSPIIWNAIYTCSMINRNYLFSHSKYEAEHIFKTWLVVYW